EVAGLDDAALAAVGGVHDLAELDPEEWADLLDGLPPVGSPVDAAAALALWRALEALAESGVRLDPAPARVPALHGGTVVVAAADDVAVAPDPMWAPLRPLVPAGRDLVEEVADLLDVATVTGPGPAPDDPGHREDVPSEVGTVVGERLPRTWERHDDLRVDGVAVPWWVEGRGGADVVVHATGPAGLAAALAVVAGRYGARHVLEEVLRDPRGAQGAVARTAWDDPQSSADAR
ncbi:MAG: sacsin N-terminal ATP-binding-like domain-containing protein, partial [Cellulosimicrobium funkei]